MVSRLVFAACLAAASPASTKESSSSPQKGQSPSMAVPAGLGSGLSPAADLANAASPASLRLPPSAMTAAQAGAISDVGRSVPAKEAAGFAAAPAAKAPAQGGWENLLAQTIQNANDPPPEVAATLAALKQIDARDLRSRVSLEGVINILRQTAGTPEGFADLPRERREAEFLSALSRIQSASRRTAAGLVAQTKSAGADAKELASITAGLYEQAAFFSVYLEPAQREQVGQAYSKAHGMLSSRQRDEVERSMRDIEVRLNGDMDSTETLPSPDDKAPPQRRPRWFSFLRRASREPTWEKYSEDFDSKARADIAKNHRVYAAARENGDSFVSFLEGKMGWRFAAKKSDVVLPDIVEFAAAYNRMVDDLIASGAISEGEALRPARVCADENQKLVYVAVGDPIPPGLKPYEGKLLSDKGWADMLAKGYIALGEPHGVNHVHFTAMEHDIGHMVGLLQHPRYMAQMRKAAQTILASPRFWRDEFHLVDAMRRRFFFAAEYLSIIKPQERGRIRSVLSLPVAKKDRYDVSEMTEHLKTLSDAQLSQLASALSREFPRAVEHVGGAAKDLIIISQSRGNRFDDTSLDALYNRVALIGRRRGRANLIDALAQLQVGILAFSDVAPEQFLREALEEKIDRKSKTYWIAVESGLFKGKLEWAFNIDLTPSGARRRQRALEANRAASDPVWKRYSDDFDSTVRSHIATNADVYAAARDAGDSFVTFLEERMGWKFDEDKDAVVLPGPLQFAADYNAMVDDLIAEGKIAPDEVLRPARAFMDRDYKVSWVKIGDPVPKDLSPYQRLLSDSDWVKMLAEGYIAMGEPGSEITSNFSPVEHDIGHMVGLLQHPRYMAEMRKVAARLMASPDIWEKEKFSYGSSLTTDLHQRLFFAAEYLAVIKPEAKERIRALLSLPAAKKDHYNVQELTDHLKGLSLDELLALASVLEREYPRVVENVGGAVKDLVLMAKASYLNTGDDSLPALYNRLKLTTSRRAPQKSNLVAALAQFEVAILEFSDVAPEVFLRQAVQEKVDPGSQAYRIMVDSGLFPGKWNFHNRPESAPR